MPAAAALSRSTPSCCVTTERRSARHTDGAGFVDSLLASGVTLERQTSRRARCRGGGPLDRRCPRTPAVADLAIVNRTPREPSRRRAWRRSARVGTLGDIAARRRARQRHLDRHADAPSSPLDPQLLHGRLTVADLVYDPLDTALLTAAAGVGALTVDGLGMLVHQAARQQRLWTGPVALSPRCRAALAAAGRTRHRASSSRDRVTSLDAPLPDRRRVARAGARGRRRGATCRARDHRRGDPGRDGAPPARLRPRSPAAVRGRRIDARQRGPARAHPGVAGGDRDQEHRVVPQRSSGTPRCRRRPARRANHSPRCGPATPIWPECRSTGSPMPATCSSGRRHVRQPLGSRPGRWPRSCCRTSASRSSRT